MRKKQVEFNPYIYRGVDRGVGLSPSRPLISPLPAPSSPSSLLERRALRARKISFPPPSLSSSPLPPPAPSSPSSLPLFSLLPSPLLPPPLLPPPAPSSPPSLLPCPPPHLYLIKIVPFLAMKYQFLIHNRVIFRTAAVSYVKGTVSQKNEFQIIPYVHNSRKHWKCQYINTCIYFMVWLVCWTVKTVPTIKFH